MNKAEDYQRLVQKRKACTLCQGLCNPSTACDGRFDSNHIGPWSRWQGNLDAQIVIVGQDWGDIGYFRDWEGKDQPIGNDTNDNVQMLMESVGITLKGPREAQQQNFFFTNAILCLKEEKGGMQGYVEKEWFSNCLGEYFKPLIDIICPKVILSLCQKGSEKILDLYDVKYPKGKSYSKLLEGSPYHLTDETVLFPLYHCGAQGVNWNRSMEKQRQDWARAAAWMQVNKVRPFSVDSQE